MNPLPLFWIFAFVLALGVLAALVWPLMRQRRSEAPGDEDAATAIFRDHKRQLDAEFAAGTLSVAERDAAQAELVARFGDELGREPVVAARTSDRARWVAAIVLVAAVPAAAGLIYVLLGNPAAVNAPAASAAPAGHGQGEATDPQIVAMIDRLAEKMKANPDDPNGWVLLGRSYFKLGRYEDSTAAFAEAAKRMPANAGLLADQAEAIAMGQGRRLAGRPAELLERALEIDPNDPKTIAMSAAAAVERGDIDGAILLYRRLKALVPADSEDAQQLTQVLAELDAARNSGKGAPPPAAVAASAAPSLPAAPTLPAAPPAPATVAKPSAVAPANAPGAGISGRVEIDPTLAAKVAAADTLFIYARNAEGSRMPLAILRGTAAELPKSFALTDAMAMTPAQTISLAKSIVVEARISKAGNAMAQSGDLRGASKPIVPGAADVRIVIDQVVP
jgi:cytochrome c-type biogenesis protein CcmH